MFSCLAGFDPYCSLALFDAFVTSNQFDDPHRRHNQHKHLGQAWTRESASQVCCRIYDLGHESRLRSLVSGRVCAAMVHKHRITSASARLLAGLLILVDSVGRLHSFQKGVRSFGQGPLFPFQTINDLALFGQSLLSLERDFGVGLGLCTQTRIFFIQPVQFTVMPLSQPLASFQFSQHSFEFRLFRHNAPL